MVLPYAWAEPPPWSADTKDVAEIDCIVFGDQVIYSTRIVGTDIKILPLAKASPARTGAP